MAGRNDRTMRKSVFMLMAIGLLTCFSSYAQDDAHLKKLTEGLLKVREKKASSDVLNKMVLDWSASGSPKITLMDEIKRDPDNESRGKDANKFKMNQVVTHVYNRQNTGMVSKGDYFNSTEKDVYYSAIEKTVKGNNSTVTYTLTGHVGDQEFVFVPFNAKAKYTVKVNGKSAEPVNEKGKEGVLRLKLPKVKKEDKITFSITNHSGSNESFAILNHNPQK